MSHVLLWRAEVAAWEGDLELARKYVNMIRERAGSEVVIGRVRIHELSPAEYPWGYNTSPEDYLTGGEVDWNVPAANYNIGLYNEPFGEGLYKDKRLYGRGCVQPGEGQIPTHPTDTGRHAARCAGPEPRVLIRVLHVNIGGECRIDTDAFDN